MEAEAWAGEVVTVTGDVVGMGLGGKARAEEHVARRPVLLQLQLYPCPGRGKSTQDVTRPR